MSSIFVKAYFLEGSNEAEVFEEIMSEMALSITRIGSYEDEGLSDLLSAQSEAVRNSTSELVASPWFWRFDPAVDWSPVSSGDKKFSVLTIEYFLQQDSPIFEKICEWMKVCGAHHVETNSVSDNEDIYFDFKRSLRCLPNSKYSFYSVSCTKNFPNSKDFLAQCHNNGFHAYFDSPEDIGDMIEQGLESVIIGRNVEKDAVILVLETILKYMEDASYVLMQDWAPADNEIVVGGASEAGIKEGVKFSEALVDESRNCANVSELHDLIRGQ